jgi:dTDP-4-dehydrorhamnose 3,5-epimerase
MEVGRLEIEGLILVTPKRYADDRGFFSETYNKALLAEEAGIDRAFVQDNFSQSKEAGTIRGMHFQAPPMAQGKLVRTIRGSILDVVVDIRQGSPTYGRWVSAILSAENWAQIWVPEGFAHGFCTLEPDTEVAYKVTEYYSAEHDRGLAWNDPALAIAWPVSAGDAVVSDKDRQHRPLAELEPFFTYGED